MAGASPPTDVFGCRDAHVAAIEELAANDDGGKIPFVSGAGRFLSRKLMEECPVPGLDPIQPDWNHRLAGKPHEYDVHDPSRPTIALPGKPWIAVRMAKV